MNEVFNEVSVNLLLAWAQVVQPDVAPERLRYIITQYEPKYRAFLTKILAQPTEQSDLITTVMEQAEPDGDVAEWMASTTLSSADAQQDDGAMPPVSPAEETIETTESFHQPVDDAEMVADVAASSNSAMVESEQSVATSPKTMIHNDTPVHSAMPYVFPQLPNAKRGEWYHATLHRQENQVYWANEAVLVAFSPECGLMWQPEKGAVEGTPNMAGEVEVTFRWRDASGNWNTQRQMLYINPNPRDLWKVLPHDADAPFVKSDGFHDTIETPFAKLVAARVRGRSHAHVGGFCDDDVKMAYHEISGVHLLAVSDGAGSAMYARYGSELAVNAVVNSILTHLDDASKNYQKLPEADGDTVRTVFQSLLEHAVYDALSAHQQAVASGDVPDLKSLSATLLVAMALQRHDGKWLTGVYWVGDGALALWQPDSGSVKLLGESDGGVYSGETRFLNAQEISEAALAKRIQVVEGEAAALILMSDGVSDPKFDTEANLSRPEYWQKLWQEWQSDVFSQEKTALALEEWLNFWSVGNHDDRTVALLLPQSVQAACADQGA